VNLYFPLGVADALAACGRPDDGDALLAVARDPARAAHFRRSAIVAFGALAPGRLDELPKEPFLELAAAAARYAAAPSDVLKGRLLTGLDHEHEADEAAAYCARLRIREAIAPISALLEKSPNHYAKDTLASALAELRK
jgi:hypothetical protein